MFVTFTRRIVGRRLHNVSKIAGAGDESLSWGNMGTLMVILRIGKTRENGTVVVVVLGNFNDLFPETTS